jgi:hypothetical protein
MREIAGLEMSGASNDLDPFDPKSLRIDPSSEAASGVEKVLLHVPVRRPHRQEFFRVHPAPEYRETVAILELREERETYIVAAELAAELATEIRLVEMRVCISRSGIVFLWAVPLPVEDGRSNAWHVTAREAAELAEAKWVRMSSNMGAGCYDVAVAPAGVSEPRWPETTFWDLLRIAFGRGKLIDSFDHAVIKQLRGE